MRKKFNEIQNRNQLANFLGLRTQTFTYILYKLDKEELYNTFSIPKKNGGTRIINAPIDPLKSIQKDLAESLYNYINNISREYNINSNISHGFIPGKSIITNARIHRNKRLVVNIDLKDFFPSFHFGRVRGFFEKNKYFLLSREVSTIIAQLTCYKGSLPQGAPTSPIITNLICQILDYKLLKIAKKYKTDYSRYADDLTFSTNDKSLLKKYDDFLLDIEKVVTKAGFKINNNKTRLQFSDSKQEVTGLSVNKKINVNKKFRKDTRAMAHTLYSKGHFFINGEPGTVNQLEGRFSYINQLDRFNNIENGNDKKNGKMWYRNLNSREKDYQEFLFYKYFINNDKPLLITEGKTDVRYIKAAIKKYKSHYPLLASNNVGTRTYNISFLNKSPRLRYFFNLEIDGGDTLINIVNSYIGKDCFPNYYSRLIKKYNLTPKNPVILVMDNEQSKNKPLHIFLNKINKTATKIDENYREGLISNQYIKIIENLYLAITPEVEGKNDSEIEDLFDHETLNTKISGKSFNRTNISNNSHYGKEIFSKYVYNNYHSINFKGFIPMLDTLSEIIKKNQQL